MSTNNDTELVTQSIDIVAALEGLQSMLFHFPKAGEARTSDIDRINGVVSAIAALAEKNSELLRERLEN